MRLDLSAGERRLVRTALLAAGVAHLLVPELLLRGARFAYDRALDVRFVARDETTCRVRLVGLAMVVAAVVWRRITQN